jgi:hypothetical protein
MDHSQRRYLGNEINQIVNLLGRGPDLFMVYNLNAPAKSAKWGHRKTEQAVGTRTKGVDDQFPVEGLEKKDLRNFRERNMKAAEKSHILPATARTVGVEKEFVDRGAFPGLSK